MNFDEPINRIGTHCAKWDQMEPIYGVPAKGGLAMWVADMDFRPPASVQRELETIVDHGVYGYFGGDADYLAAIQWWMQTRHGWQVERDHIFTTHGLVHGVGMCLDTFTQPGDGIVVMTPVYHAFARVIKASGREVVECQLANVDGQYQMDFDTWDAQMTGRETMLILCSPHNPGGRIWTRAELQGVADFARRHGLLVISDEIHHDLVLPGHKHIPMAVAAPDLSDRLIMMTATTKTFNLAAGLTGNVIIADPDLRARFSQKMQSMGISGNAFGIRMATAAYSPEGAAWVDELSSYLAENAKILDQGVARIPGVRSMKMQATYLAWVDFTGTGMTPAEFTRRVEQGAQIAVNHGATFGTGGESFLRFNIACPRAVVIEAVSRLQAAFADLQ